MGNLVRLAQFSDRIAAEGVRNALEAHGIMALISGGDLGGAAPHLAATFGVDLLVEESDLETARGVVQSAAPAVGVATPREPLFDTPGLQRFRRLLLLLWGLVAIGIFGAALHGPVDQSRFTQVWVGVSGMFAPLATLAYVAAKSRARRKHRLSQD